MAETSIEWTNYTFSPWMGCAKAHAGCTNCYAEKSQPVVLRKGGGVKWGEVWQGGQRVVVADSTWKKPYLWARDAARAGERRRVFCSSLADVLEVPGFPPFEHLTTERRERVNEARKALDGARLRLWDTIRKTANMVHPSSFPHGAQPASRGGLDWLLLTKRPENAHLIPADVRPLVWLGTSVSDQKTADEWVPRLLRAEGFRLRFLSVEPLVGPVDISWALTRNRLEMGAGFLTRGVFAPGLETLRPIDWVIVGGESGPGARPCNVEWVRSILHQCREAGVPCFVKQLGASPRSLPIDISRDGMTLLDGKGGDMTEWPQDLRVREFPEVRHA